MNVSAWSIRNPIPAILLFLLLTLAGLMGFRAMTVRPFHYAVILLTVAAISLYSRIKPEK